MRTILILIAIISLGGCASGDAKKTAEPILKIKKGTSWQYEVKLLGEKSHIDLSITQIEGKKYHDNKKRLLEETPTGIKNREIYFLKYPIKKGQSWVNKSKVCPEVATIESVNEVFNFGPDKIEGCIKVSYSRMIENKQKFFTIRTFCPGLWLTKMESYIENKQGIAIPQSSFTLVSFSY